MFESVPKGNSAYGYNGLYPIGTTSTGTVILIPYQTFQTGERLRIYEVDVDIGVGGAHEHLVALPPAARLDEAIVSPDGRRIAWLVYQPARPHGRVDVWISKTDGSKMVQIGSVPVKPLNRRYFFGDDFPRELQWLPDNQRMSFVRKGELLVFSVH